MQVAAQIEVQRLSLADQRRAIGGELDDPALVDLERGAEDGLLVLVEAFEVLHRALVREDRLPRVLGVETLRAPASSASAGLRTLNEPDSVLCV